MGQVSTATPAPKGKIEKAGNGRTSGDLIADFRRIASIAHTLSESSRWDHEMPKVTPERMILKRETFGLDESTSKPKRTPEETEYLSISRSKEADIRVLFSLNSGERENLGLKRVASTRTCEGRAEQYHETFFEMPSAVYKYSLVEPKKS